MPKIFISYRRDDSAYPAQSIHEKLVSHFGEDAIFFDVDSIPIGMDFHGILNDEVAKCDVLLAVIGDQWLSAEDRAGKRRLDNPDDFVRIEIEAALSRDIPVVPVLVGKASVPLAEEMPESLNKLARRNAAEVRPGRDFRSHLDRLVQGIENVVEDSAVNRRLEIITNSIGMKLASVPAGEFMMGKPNDFVYDSELPQHKVEITKSFFLGVNPVTQAEYEKITSDNPSNYKGDDRKPVEMVQWFDAVKFCNKLSDEERLPPFYRIVDTDVSILAGGGYRLPTEAEWEYACRADTTTKWSFGDEEWKLYEYAWYSANGDGTTHPVRQKKPNPWGLHDMHGNVFEWCWDWFGKDYYRESPASDPSGPASGLLRVMRGGYFNSKAGDLRSACRASNSTDYRFRRSITGFRVARNCK